MTYAPIALFVYKRLQHAKQTVQALQKNAEAKDSDLYIFCDGAKNEGEKEEVVAVHVWARSVGGFKEVHVIEREHNSGLVNSIIKGVTKVLMSYESIIVLEDDLVVSPFFLQYMNDALEIYSADDAVGSISGYTYPIQQSLPETFFIRGADCWGWATWKRAWKLFNTDSKKLLSELAQRGLNKEFDVGSYPYTNMLKMQGEGLNDSWAIRWHASLFLAEKLTLYPHASLVSNIGADGSGTHKSSVSIFDVSATDHPISVERRPLQEDEYALGALRKFFSSGFVGLTVRAIRIKNTVKLTLHKCVYRKNKRI